MNSFKTRCVADISKVFGDYFIDAKIYYIYRFNVLPNMDVFRGLDGEAALGVISEKMADRVLNRYSSRTYNRQAKQYDHDITIIELKDRVVLEFYDDYVYVYHDGSQAAFLNEIVALISPMKRRQRSAPREINLVVRSRRGLELRPVDTKRTTLDIDLFYEDDFKQINQLIQTRLKKKNDKGIVLLHGMPGTGKTTYLRYLIGRINKRVLFLSPSVGGNLMDPDFIELLVEHPNSVLIIEDAENIIMDRRYNGTSAVSNLLNISDGLMADFLNVQLICTFNSDLAFIDQALLRQGRLIARYGFGKLSINKAQRLSRHLGHDVLIREPMTIAELTRPDHDAEPAPGRAVIGFRGIQESWKKEQS